MKRDRGGAAGCRWVSAYAVTRHWGGPEEGGWWWDKFTRVATSRRIKTRRVFETIARMEKAWAHIREGDISSVLGGTDLVVMPEQQPGEWTTRRRPRYE